MGGEGEGGGKKKLDISKAGCYHNKKNEACPCENMLKQ